MDEMYYSILLVLHVISATLLGVYIVLPWQVKQLTSLSEERLAPYLSFLLSFIRVGHYSIIGLLFSGGLMITFFHTIPSMLWVIVSITLLLIIGAWIGILQAKLKKVLKSHDPVEQLQKENRSIFSLSFSAACFIIIAIVIMTNPTILS
jgi:hypothetical protein